MKRGAFLTIACSGLALAACSAPSVHVRAIADPAAKLRSGGDELTQARNMLALNAVGLALEGFRKLEIEQPTNPDVFSGMAQCYAAMGRYDLEATNYEKALAYAPHDPSILSAYASSLERQGEIVRAARVRTELALAVAPPMQAPQTGTLTVKLPPAQPVSTRMAESASARSPAAEPKPAKAIAASELPPMRPMENQVAIVDLVTLPVKNAGSRSVRALQAQATANVTLDRPSPTPSEPALKVEVEPQTALVAMPLRKNVLARGAPVIIAPVETVKGNPAPSAVPLIATAAKPRLQFKPGPNTTALAAMVAAMGPAIKPREPIHQNEQERATNGLRLERLSVGEVALVTTQAPIWRGQMVATNRPAVGVQWLPIRTAEARPAIQLINAARIQGLAARTRIALADRGWRRMRIGNYRDVRQRSLVLYSSEHAPTGRRLAAQFKCKAVEVKGNSILIVLLGRDAASRKSASLRA